MRSALVTGSVLTATAGLVAGGLAYASLYPTSQIFGRVLLAGRDPREVALTYDDGPNPVVTPLLLDVLASRGVRATFFLIGSFVRKEPGLAREIAAAGHLIGNHTMTHPRLAWQSAERIRRELRDTNRAIEDAIGAPVRHFRPPHGARRPYVMEAANELGLVTVLWNVTAYDWKPIDGAAIAANVRRGIDRNGSRARGSNVLMHDGGHLGLGVDRRATVTATEEILRQYAVQRFVTVDAWDERHRPRELRKKD